MNAILLAGLLPIAVATSPQVEVAADLQWSVASPGEIAAQPWWRQQADPALAALIDEMVRDNGDLAAAWDRTRMARAGALQSFSALLPSAAFELGADTSAYDGSLCQSVAAATASAQAFASLDEALDQAATDPLAAFEALGGVSFAPPPGNQDLCTTSHALLVAGWTVDLFGRQTLAWRASHHEASAAEGDQQAQILAMVTAISEAWYDVVAAQDQIVILERQVQAQRQLLELIALRYERGGASGLDVLQQRQTVASTEALLPSARAIRDARLRTLSAMAGHRPGALPTASSALPAPQALPPLGRPIDLLQTRPELVAAARRVASAQALRTSAQLALLPTFRLSANTGWTGLYDDGLQTEPTWGAGAALTVPLFQGGYTHAGIRRARAGQDQAVHHYNQAVLDAIAEVDAAILYDEELRNRLAAVQVQEETAVVALEESTARFLEGLDSYLAVLAAQAAHQQAELTLLQARRDVAGARVRLHDALGNNGWSWEATR